MPAGRSSRRTLVLCFALACVVAPAAARAQDTLRIPATQPRVNLPAGTQVARPPVNAAQPPANIQGATQQLVTVPNLSGRTVAEARRLLAAAGLELGRVAEGTGTGTAGTIMQQQPRAGSGVAPRSDVRVWLVPARQVAGQPPVLTRPPPVTRPPVTQEPQRATVPRLVGRTAQDARVALAAAGLEPGAVQELNVSGTPGTVVRQSPRAGTAVQPGSPVGLWIVAPRQAAAPRDSTVRVPDLAGATVEDARERLAAAGLSVGGLADAAGTAVRPG
ncbi:MAG TPA: PASTA domain-containing protein, partial [Longimicrobium sp.]